MLEPPLSTCLVCQSPFTPVRKKVHGLPQIYCSPACRDEQKLRSQRIRDHKRRARNSWRKKFPSFPCCVCGENFKPFNDRHKFCSRACRAKIERIRETKRQKLRRIAARQNATRSPNQQELTLD